MRAFRSAVLIAVTCIAVGCASAPCIVFITLASALPALLRVSRPAPVARASTRVSNASSPRRSRCLRVRLDSRDPFAERLCVKSRLLHLRGGRIRGLGQ